MSRGMQASRPRCITQSYLAQTDAAYAESRVHPRITLPRGTFVAWRQAGEHGVSRAQSISLGGVFVADPNPPAAGEIVQLYFDVLGGGIRARAIVRHSHAGKGMGLQFTALAPEARSRLNYLMRKLLS
jgi:PilZ domain-containing protein